MSPVPTKGILTFSLFFICVMLPLSSQAFLSPQVNQAMDNANICRQSQQNFVYDECMRQNNQQIKKNIQNNHKQQSINFSTSQQLKLKQNINKKLESNQRLCEEEKKRFEGSMAGERRYYYCIYENLLETLINVDRNIEIYTINLK